MLRKGADPVQDSDLLIQTINFGHLEATRILIAQGVPCGSNHLEAAVSSGMGLEMVELFLAAGISPEANQHSALRLAFEADNREVIERLLDYYRSHPRAT